MADELNIDLSREIIKLANSEQVFADILIQEDEPITCKFPRGWEALSDYVITREELKPFLLRLDQDWEKKISSGEGAFDRAITLSTSRLRCNAYMYGDKNGENKIAISIRRLALKPSPINELGLPQGVVNFVNRGKGLVLITGATGAGKTTTQASLLEYINANRAAHIVTIEQPIEYVFQRNKSIFSQREVPTHVATFGEGLKSALRQKPDVIVIGEMRDRETVDTILHAAESGHLVLATMHTNSAISAISKLLSFYDANEIAHKAKTIASVLIGVICQSLLPNRQGDDYVLAYEILANNQQIAHNIQNQKLELIKNSVMTSSGKDISILLNTVLADKLKRNEINQLDANMATYDIEGLEEAIRQGR